MSPSKSEDTPSQRLFWLALFPLFLLAIVYPPRMHGYLNPYDEGLWLGAAQDLLNGKMLYRDTFFHYGPLLGFFLQAALHFITPTLDALRLVFWAMNAAGLLVIYFSLIRWVRSTPLRVSSALFLWTIALSAPFPTIPTAARYSAGFLPFLFWPREKGNSQIINLAALLSGASAAAALFISQEVGVASVMSTAFYFYVVFPDTTRKKWALSGGMILSLSVLSWLGIHHSVKAFIDCSFWQTSTIVFKDRLPLPSILVSPWTQPGPWFLPWRQLAVSLAIYVPAFSYIAFLALIVLRRLRNTWTDPTLIAFALYAILAASSAWVRSDQWHIYFALSPALFFWAAWTDRESDLAKPWATLITIFCGALLTVPHTVARQYKDRVLKTTARPTEMLRAGTSRLPAGQAGGYEFLVTWIQAHVAKGESFLFYPYDGTIYFLADRPNPTYYSVLALATTTAAQNRIIQDMNSHKPRWVIWDTENTAFDGVPIKTFLGPIEQTILKDYTRYNQTGPFVFLKRKDLLP